ncbi:8553_t:CDS:2 [Ambispora gerdemannii]|uniref:8553_t:CDS:1 n=1 Tax=Ambispora gerdemannii TaxID=144530 RepID=A0A9N9AM74_9GLOM|nr:8553_t:CDS:2 [Ambispora gerdemannii]
MGKDFSINSMLVHVLRIGLTSNSSSNFVNHKQLRAVAKSTKLFTENII